MRIGTPRLLAAPLALAAALACRTVAPPPPVPVTGEEARIAQLLARVQDAGATRATLRAVGRVRIDAETGSGSFREVVAAQRPARLRLETLNLLGQTQALLVTDGERFGFWDGREMHRGPLSADVLRDHLGLDLEPEEAVRVLLAAPLGAPVSAHAILAQGEDRLVEIEDARLRFDAQGDLTGFEALQPNGALRWSVRYGRWQAVDETRYPRRVTLAFPSTDLRAEFSLDRVEINPPLEARLFRVPAAFED